MNINPFRLMIFTENIMCLYRNYTLLSKRARILTCFHIMFEFSFVIAHIITRIKYHSYNYVTDNVYFYLITGNTMVLISLSLYNSKKYKKLLVHFNAYYCYFRDDAVYIKKLELNQKIIILILIINCLIRLFAFIYYVLILEWNLYYSKLFYVNLLMCDTRFLIEFPFLHCLLAVLSEQLNGVIRSITIEIITFTNENQNATSNDCGEQLKIFDKWSNVYQNIEKSSKLFNSIFGFQVTIMLATIIIYYIILLYTMTQLSVTGNFAPVMVFMYSYSLTVFLISLYILSQAAQRAQNSSQTLRRKLCTLLIHSVASEKYNKATMDLLRLVSTHPIRTQAFGSINVDMSLLPTCLAFCTSYTVIALQFNNVL